MATREQPHDASERSPELFVCAPRSPLGRTRAFDPVGVIATVACALLAPVAAFAADGPAAEPLSAGPPAGVSVTERGTVEMHVADLPLSSVLQLLSLEGKRNIVTSPNVKGTVTANLYGVSFEEALDAILVSNGAGYRVRDNFVYVYTTDELAEIDAANAPPPASKVYRLNYLSAADAKSYIGALLADDESVTTPPAPATGLRGDAEEGGGFSDATQDFVLVTARPSAHAQVEALLAEVDVRPAQVLIEATILRADLKDENALGVDFTLVGGVDLELLGASSRGLTTLTLGSLPTDRFEQANAIATTDFSGNVTGGGFTFGIIKDQVAVFLRALEEVTDTTVLANPKVLALNKQKGQVIVGRRDGYMTTTVTETQAVQTVEFLETGTQLIFRPFIGDDGFIRVEIHPEDSVGFVSAQGLPSEQTTEVTVNVIVRDGETILIGGLFREVTTDSRSRMPGLGSLPIVGPLFGSRADSTSREEVIILLTIHVVKDHDAYATASREMYERTERIRVGARQGLMWHGRDRIAQTHYHRALDSLAGGDRDKALWHLNIALHNSGQMVAAIELKESILGERAWEEDGAGNRFFLHQMISRERGYQFKPFGRPAPPSIQKPPDNLKEEGT
jgi:type IV pilus assembly protein PilQ